MIFIHDLTPVISLRIFFAFSSKKKWQNLGDFFFPSVNSTNFDIFREKYASFSISQNSGNLKKKP
jgi:hypothetical protein